MTYIELEKACSEMQRLFEEDVEQYGVAIPDCFDAERAIEALRKLPTSSAITLGTAEWIKVKRETWIGADLTVEKPTPRIVLINKCSACGYEAGKMSDDWHCCPNCGKKIMRERVVA